MNVEQLLDEVRDAVNQRGDFKDHYQQMEYVDTTISKIEKEIKKLKNDFERVDDAAAYWRVNFKAVFEDAVSGTDRNVIANKYLNDYQQ